VRLTGAVEEVPWEELRLEELVSVSTATFAEATKELQRL
jgi:hypothetical protein